MANDRGSGEVYTEVEQTKCSFLCGLRCKLGLSITGTVVGVVVFAILGATFKNWNAALWGLLSGLVALAVTVIHIQYARGVWQRHYTHLRSLMLLGCFIQLAGVCGFTVYLVLAITQHQGVSAYGPGYYVTMVWCFMTWKWGFGMFYYSRSYRKEYVDISDKITDHPPHISDSVPYEKI